MSPAAGPRPAFRLLVVLGTDHHRFDRLVAWADAWTARHAPCVTTTVQHGSSAPPRVCTGHDLIPHSELQRLMAQADAIVTHGGPATISEARRHGLRPVVVPRDPVHGEHVDDHQQLFARRLADRGLVRLCRSGPELEEVLGEALRAPSSLRLEESAQLGDAAEVAAAVARVGAVVDGLARARRRR